MRVPGYGREAEVRVAGMGTWAWWTEVVMVRMVGKAKPGCGEADRGVKN